jgi:hypothetical protein
MDNATFSKIKDLILKNQDVAVIVGQNPSLDEMAAGLGMYLVLAQMGKNATIASSTNPTVALSSLVGIDKVQRNVGVSGDTGDLTVSFPYREGEIDKVSYTLDNGFLNIVVKAGEKGLSFQQSDVTFKRDGKAPTLVFFIGVPRLADVSSIYTPSAETTIVNIDNKPENEKYGTIAVTDTKWSSVSEQVADFVTLLEPQIELDADTAQNLLDGIDFATEDFTSPRTSYLAFEVAGILMKKGATRQKAQNIAQNSKGANTMPNANQFFPPQPQPFVPQPTSFQPQAPTFQAPVNQQMPQPRPMPTQQPQNPWQPSPVPQQPVEEPQPFVPQPVQTSAPKAPPDWLTPKVYKGSSIL